MKLTKYQKSVLTTLMYECVTSKWGTMCIKCKRNKGQMSHIYPKGKYRRLEFEPDNVLPLCYHCHIHWWHKNPIEAQEWLKTKVHPRILNKLKLTTLERSKWSMDFNLVKLYLIDRLYVIKKNNWEKKRTMI